VKDVEGIGVAYGAAPSVECVDPFSCVVVAVAFGPEDYAALAHGDRAEAVGCSQRSF